MTSWWRRRSQCSSLVKGFSPRYGRVYRKWQVASIAVSRHWIRDRHDFAMLTAKLADLASLLIYIVGTIVCSQAKTGAVFVGMRVLQSLGSSAVLALGAGTLADMYDVRSGLGLSSCISRERMLTQIHAARLTNAGRNSGFITPRLCSARHSVLYSAELSQAPRTGARLSTSSSL